jgi:hypothetical protein
MSTEDTTPGAAAGHLVRPKPDRTRPIRNLGGAYLDEPAKDESTTVRGSRKQVSAREDVVVRAVQLGYRIADDQMRRGQDWARRLRPGSGGSGFDITDAADRGFALWREMAALMVETAESAMAGPATLRTLLQKMLDATGPAPSSRRHAAHSGGTGTAAPTTVTSGDYRPRSAGTTSSCPVQISATVPVRVKVHLRTDLTDDAMVYPLYLDRTGRAITGVSVISDGKGQRLLKANVPPNTASGCYRGAIVRPSERDPIGFIEIEVGADGKPGW